MKVRDLMVKTDVGPLGFKNWGGPKNFNHWLKKGFGLARNLGEKKKGGPPLGGGPGKQGSNFFFFFAPPPPPKNIFFCFSNKKERFSLGGVKK